MQAACRDVGLSVPSEAQTAHIIGLGLADAMAYLLPELGPAGYLAVAERYRCHFLMREQEITLFEGVREMLAELIANGFLLGVATGKSRGGLDRDFTATGLRNLFMPPAAPTRAFRNRTRPCCWKSSTNWVCRQRHPDDRGYDPRPGDGREREDCGISGVLWGTSAGGSHG